MGVHKVSGRFLQDALKRALDAYGGDAVVLSQRSTSTGSVTLAVADERPDDSEELVAMQGEARRLLATGSEMEVAPVLPPRTDDIERSMQRTGCCAILTERICSAVRDRLDEGLHPLDLAGEEIGSMFSIYRLPRNTEAITVLALLGPAGSGKTTCAAKVISRWTRSGEQVGLASFDARRPGSAESLRALGRELGARTALVRDGGRLAHALGKECAPRLIVLEGTGDPVRDHLELDRFEAEAEAAGLAVEVQRVAVLAATHGEETLERALTAGPAHCCALTMLDQTTRPARLLERVLGSGVPTAFISDGPDITRLHRPTSDLFADLLLRGRIS